MHMKKFINHPEDVVPVLLEGFVLPHPGKVPLRGKNIISRKKRKEGGKVGIVTLGGSGHEPGLSGFVGDGLLDFSVAGEIFAAPGAPGCLEAIKLAENGAGVLFIVLNHAGDILSSNLTMQLAEREGLNVKRVITHEDIAGGPNLDD